MPRGIVKRVLLLSSILLLLLSGMAFAREQWIKLKSGETLRARIISEAGDSIKVVGPGGERLIPKEQIQYIRDGPQKTIGSAPQGEDLGHPEGNVGTVPGSPAPSPSMPQ
jgi:hypothetical protein